MKSRRRTDGEYNEENQIERRRKEHGEAKQAAMGEKNGGGSILYCSKQGERPLIQALSNRLQGTTKALTALERFGGITVLSF